MTLHKMDQNGAAILADELPFKFLLRTWLDVAKEKIKSYLGIHIRSKICAFIRESAKDSDFCWLHWGSVCDPLFNQPN
jgi:hypothetical protein